MKRTVTPQQVLDYLNKRGLDLFDVTRSNIRERVAPLQTYRSRRYAHIPTFTVHNGCTKAALVFDGLDFVVKIPFQTYCGSMMRGARNSQNGWDYCLRECEVYEAAERFGVAQFLAKTELLGYVNGYPVYVQQRCEVADASDYYRWDYYVQDHGTVRTSTQAKRLAYSVKGSSAGFHHLTAHLCVLSFGYRATQRFIRFAAEQRLGDWHSGNYGANIHGKGIIFCDYTGFDC